MAVYGESANISVYHAPISQALAGANMPNSDDEFDPRGYNWDHSDERIWRARETRTGVTTVGETREEALKLLADALDEHEETGLGMGEFWWVYD